MDQKEFKKVIDGSLKDLVLPRLDKIEKKLAEHDEKLESIIGAVAETKVDITEMKEDITDSKYTADRIETRLNSVVKNQDDIYMKTRQLNRCVLHLESKKP